MSNIENEISNRLTVKEYRELCEGLTQRNPSFRDAILELEPNAKEMMLPSMLERVQNRLNHAMLDIPFINTRQFVPHCEVEVSGVVHFDTRELCIYQNDGEQRYSFDELDPSYVGFLQEQQLSRFDNCLLLSSIALRTSNMLLEDSVEVPDLDAIDMNVPKELPATLSRQVLERAFSNSMILMNHLQHEMEKFGLDKTYGINKDDLITHVSTNMFEASFEHSIAELEETAKDVVTSHEL